MAIAAGLIAAASLPTPAGAEQPSLKSSLGPAFTKALELRHMQTELMVAALSCGPASRAGYNAFVQRYQTRLVAGGRNLRRLFGADRGRAGRARLDDFVTRLANESSRLSLADKQAFCARTGDSLTALLTGAPVELDRQRAFYRCRMTAGRPECAVITGQQTAAGGLQLQ